VLELLGEDGPVPLPAPKHRRLLAALALGGGRTQSNDELLDAIWGEAPPSSARKLLQVYVSQLRRVLPDGATIATRPTGYALELPGECLDATRFERLAAEASRASDEANPALAASLAQRALALWRGRAYADVAYEDFARGEAERLEELRLVARELRLRAKLDLGGASQMTSEVLALADEHPLRESVQELAMLGLYCAGRQSEALDRFAATRSRLRDELGLEPGPKLRALQRRILEHSTDLGTAAAPPSRMDALPEPPGPIVGRAEELDRLRTMLRSGTSRLIVLAGAGGSGKTRLAIEIARERASSFANGAVMVELAPVHDPSLVVPTIAHALGVAETPGEALLDTLANALRPRELLLVLDNAEHVRAAAPAWVELVSRASRLTVLVTSRAVLHVSGEHVFPVGPLQEDDAVELFIRRARARHPTFELDRGAEHAVREICRRLDGLPLALELAAARARVLDPQTLLDRLASRLTILTGGARDLPARQQTLRETVAWSTNLLSEHEKDAFAALAVFPAGATLEAAETVGGADLDVLTTLVDHHLVRREDASGTSRFSQLETIREYAQEALASNRTLNDAVRGRHTDWCIALAERAEPELTGDTQAEWFARLEAEHDNLRAALVELQSREDSETLLRLAVQLFRFWYVRGYLTEGRGWLEQALAGAASVPALLRRRALTGAAAIALLQGDYVAATSFAEAGLAAAREMDEPLLIANALSNLGAVFLAARDDVRAEGVLEEAVALARAAADERVLALALNNLGDVALTVGDYERAEPLFEESLAFLRARGDTANIARSLFNLGSVDLMLNRHTRAHERLDESLALSHEAGDKEDLAWSLEGLAGLAAATGDGERAALLLGAAQSLLEQMGAAFKPFERHLHETTVTRASELCGPETFAALLARGAGMTLDEATTVAGEIGSARSRS